METEERSRLRRKKILLLVNSALLCVGSTGSPLLLRLYFIHGGKRIWLSSWLLTAGFPILLIPLAISYLHRRRDGQEVQIVLMELPLFLSAALIGTLTGFDDYLYAYGVAKLPVSTSSLIIASQLGFTAGFAFVLVKQKFTFYSINAVALLTVGSGVLALHASGDRPSGESSKDYVVGFLLTVAASALYGFVLPLTELSYRKSKQSITYSLVLEFQFVISLFGTLFCTVGMILNKDFQVMPRESIAYGLGEVHYYLVVFWNVILGQAFFLGAVGVIFCASSLLSGILIAVMLPVTEVLAVVFYKEKFQAEKGVALVLSLWGFVSYFYGEMKQGYKNKQQQQQNTETELSQTAS